MKKLTAGVDRLLVLVLGIALVGGGAFALAWYLDVEWAVRRLSTFDRALFADLPQHDWWQPALAGAAAVFGVVGILLLVGNLSPRRTRTVQISRTESSSVRVDLGAAARGVAGELARFPGVRRSRGSAIDDRGVATIAVTVDVAVAIDLAAFTALAERTAQRVADSLDGAPVATRVQVHVDAPKVQRLTPSS